MLSHARTVLSLYHSLSPSLCLSLSLPPWWLMANAALVHLYIPPHPSLANRCEILDMAWIWLPGEKRGGGGGRLDWGGEQFPPPTASISSAFFTFDYIIDILSLHSLEIKLLHFHTLLMKRIWTHWTDCTLLRMWNYHNSFQTALLDDGKWWRNGRTYIWVLYEVAQITSICWSRYEIKKTIWKHSLCTSHILLDLFVMIKQYVLILNTLTLHIFQLVPDWYIGRPIYYCFWIFLFPDISINTCPQNHGLVGFWFEYVKCQVC